MDKEEIDLERLRPRRPRGFTLVELLVVTGIIAMLIGILLPSLGKARAASRSVACLANLRSLGQAFVLYANANRNWWPSPARPGQSPPDWTGTPAVVGIYWHRDFIYPLLNRKPVPAEQVARNTFIEDTIFECPSADKTASGVNFMSGFISWDDQQQWSYGMSARLNDVKLPAGIAHGDVNGTRNKHKNVAKVKNSALTCLLIDNIGAWSGTINDDDDDAQWVRLRGALRRHSSKKGQLFDQYTSANINTAARRAEQGTLNVLYADYHAAPISYFDIPKAVSVNGANAKREFFQFWCGTDSTN